MGLFSTRWSHSAWQSVSSFFQLDSVWLLVNGRFCYFVFSSIHFSRHTSCPNIGVLLCNLFLLLRSSILAKVSSIQMCCFVLFYRHLIFSWIHLELSHSYLLLLPRLFWKLFKDIEDWATENSKQARDRAMIMEKRTHLFGIQRQWRYVMF